MSQGPTWNPEFVLLLLGAQAALVALAIVVTVARSMTSRRVIGAECARDVPGRRLRQGVLLGGLAVVGGCMLLVGGDELGSFLLPGLAALVAAALLVFVTPGAHDAVLGDRGVRRGYHSRSFEQLEEWRQTGDHLRFRLFGEWTSVPVPPDSRAQIRARLEELAPGRESRFAH